MLLGLGLLYLTFADLQRDAHIFVTQRWPTA